MSWRNSRRSVITLQSLPLAIICRMLPYKHVYTCTISLRYCVRCSPLRTVLWPQPSGLVFLLGERFSTIQRKPSTMDCPLLYTTIRNLYDDIKLYFDISRNIFRIRIEEGWVLFILCLLVQKELFHLIIHAFITHLFTESLNLFM